MFSSRRKSSFVRLKLAKEAYGSSGADTGVGESVRRKCCQNAIALTRTELVEDGATIVVACTENCWHSIEFWISQLTAQLIERKKRPKTAEVMLMETHCATGIECMIYSYEA